jgi:hypothetical protein
MLAVQVCRGLWLLGDGDSGPRLRLLVLRLPRSMNGRSVGTLKATVEGLLLLKGGLRRLECASLIGSCTVSRRLTWSRRGHSDLVWRLHVGW